MVAPDDTIQRARALRRDDWLDRQGVRVIRIAARTVLADVGAALEVVRLTVGR